MTLASLLRAPSPRSQAHGVGPAGSRPPGKGGAPRRAPRSQSEPGGETADLRVRVTSGGSNDLTTR